MSDKLTLNQMQELLPDYLFDRLEPDIRKIFEANLIDYSEVQKEIADAKIVFDRLNSMDIDEKIKGKTRNLSVKVNNRLNSNRLQSKRKSFIRILAPSLAMLIAAIFFIQFYDAKITNDLPQSNGDKFIEITKNDIGIVFPELIHSNEEHNTSKESKILEPDILHFGKFEIDQEESDFAAIIIDDMMQDLIRKVSINNNSNILIDDYFGIDLIDDLKELNTNELEQLMEELENEEFI